MTASPNLRDANLKEILTKKGGRFVYCQSSPYPTPTTAAGANDTGALDSGPNFIDVPDSCVGGDGRSAGVGRLHFHLLILAVVGELSQLVC